MNTQIESQATPSGFPQVGQGAVKVYANLAGEMIHCLSGCLWVSLEDDGKDHILLDGECLAVPRNGRVLVSGPGFFGLSRDGESLDIPMFPDAYLADRTWWDRRYDSRPLIA